MSQNVPLPSSIKPYSIGFISSVVLTLLTYFLAVEPFLSGWLLDAAIALLALSQILIQFLIFLNVGKESKPRWNLLVFLFTMMIALILVVGSLWIMYHLNYNMMPHA